MGKYPFLLYKRVYTRGVASTGVLILLTQSSCSINAQDIGRKTWFLFRSCIYSSEGKSEVKGF